MYVCIGWSGLSCLRELVTIPEEPLAEAAEATLKGTLQSVEALLAAPQEPWKAGPSRPALTPQKALLEASSPSFMAERQTQGYCHVPISVRCAPGGL